MRSFNTALRNNYAKSRVLEFQAFVAVDCATTVTMPPTTTAPAGTTAGSTINQILYDIKHVTN